MEAWQIADFSGIQIAEEAALRICAATASRVVKVETSRVVAFVKFEDGRGIQAKCDSPPVANTEGGT